ncbi:MAG: peptide-binding protein [Candidatus Firestonebacteria bacterium]
MRKLIILALGITIIVAVGGYIFTKSMVEDMKKFQEDMRQSEDKALNKTDTSTYGDTLVDSSIGDASILNPILLTDSASSDIAGLVFNGLVKYDKDIKLIGDLAERWDVSKDGLTITFYLRKGVKWQDGVELTAEDVEFTYKKLTDPNTKSPYKSNYEIIKIFKIINKYTVQVEYSEPFAPALESWGTGILPKHLLKNLDINTAKFNRNPVGTGPYRFKEWKTAEKISLEYYDNYFEGRSYIDKYLYRIIPDQSVQFMELKSGGIDMMGLTPDLYKTQANTSKFNSKINKYRYPAFAYTYLGFNLLSPLFSDKKVRQAISYAINKKDIIDGVLLGLGRESTGPFPPESWAYNSNVTSLPYDLNIAREKLKEAGWSDSDNDGLLDKDGKKFEFMLMTNQGNKPRELVVQIIQQQLAKIGIKVEIRIIAWTAFINEYIDKKKFDAVVLGWSLSRDPDCYDIWHSSKIKEKEYNFVSYKNQKIDKLLVEGRRTFDIEKRKKIYYKIHKILADDVPYVFLYVPDALVVVDNRINGIKIAPIGISYNFIKWYVPKFRQKYVNVMGK